jgi:hypothetical protein
MTKEYKGIEIRYKDWIIRSDPRKNYSHYFDVCVMKMVEEVDGKTRKKTGKTVPKEIDVGYGYSFETALKTVIRQAIASSEDVTDIQSYLKEYRKEKQQLESLIK